MSRLPQLGGDNGTWGNILNDYLSQSHKSDGTLKDDIVTSATITDNSLTNVLLVDGTIQEAKLSSSLQSKINNLTITRRYNVCDFGAIGNGTTDDSVAIKAAQAAMTSGSALYFPPGIYRFAQQAPTDGAAILLAGMDDVAVIFEPGARLLMNNLDNQGAGTSHGIRIEGAAERVTLVNPTIEWLPAPSARTAGDGISVLGYPSGGSPAGGWTGSTGTVQYLTILNARIIHAPQTGAVIMGCSDVTVLGLNAIETLADGLHFNACRRITINGHHAFNNGDDGLAFVTYQHDTNIGVYGNTDGPFNQPTLGEWNNSGSVAGVTVTGGRANGVRIQGAHDLAISAVSVIGKDSGLSINSAKISQDNDWTSLASQNVTFDNVAIAEVGTGVILATNAISADDPPEYWDFSGVQLRGVAIRDCENWALSVETADSDNTIFSGITLRDIVALSINPDDTDPEAPGGHGGIRLASLHNSVIDNVKLITDHVSNILIIGAAQIRGYVNGVDVGHVTVEELPSSNLTLNNIVLDGPGRILIQDIAGITFGQITSNNADGVGVVLYRVKESRFVGIKSYLPGRGTGIGRGIQLSQCYNVDIDLIEVTTDDHTGSLWQAVELGGGNSDYPGGKGIRVEKVIYVSGRNDTASDIVVQGGPYAPTDWHIQAFWRHEGEVVPTWRQQLYGETNTAYLATTTLTPTWMDAHETGHFEFNDIVEPGRYLIVCAAGGFLFTGDTTYHQPPGAPGWVYLDVITVERDFGMVIMQYYTSITDGVSPGFRSKIGTDQWTDWRLVGNLISNNAVTEAMLASNAVTENKIAGSAVTENKILNGSVTEAKLDDGAVSDVKLATDIRISLEKADTAVQLNNPLWIDGPVDFNDQLTAGIFIIAGEFLNGPPTTYHQPGDTGVVKLTITVIPKSVGDPSYPAIIIQEYISMDAADHGGQRRRYGGTWSSWAKY